jgi:tetratricopeptide (TPR) repeat protein
VKVEAGSTFRVLEGRVGLHWAIPWLPALAAFAPVLGLAAAQGGYFPTAWGWASVPLFWAAAVALLVRGQVRLNTYERVFLTALAAFVGWIALTVAWSNAPAESILEIERGLVYVAAASAVLLVSRGRFARRVLGGLLAAISLIAAFSLLTRLVPDRVGVYDRSAVYRLAQPIGYWNGLGLFAAMGALIALGFAARARTSAARAAGAGVLVVLLPTLYFTFGRAAWIALAIGLAAAVVVDPRRLQLLATLFVVGLAPAIAVLLASRETGLTHAGTPLVQAAHDGHRLVVILAFLMVGNGAVAAGFAYLARRVDVPSLAQRTFAVAVALVLAVTAGVAFSRYGDPVTLAKKGYESFKAAPPHAASSNLNRRLLSFSGNGRADLWGLAWDDARRHAVLGSGAGTYERYFLAHQPPDVGRVRDAHGLYIETLAEVGPIGLALLIVVLITPLATLRRARRHPLVPAAVGAYIAYLVHTGVDWDWELPAVTLVGLLCGASILLFGRRWAPPRPLSFPTRLLGTAAAAAAAEFAAIALLGNSALSRSETAREQGKPAPAAADARRARSLMPWSPRPWEALGRAQEAAGLLPQARKSFRKAISMDRGDWRLWYDLAGATTGSAQRRALQHAVSLFPQSGLLPNVGKTRSRP